MVLDSPALRLWLHASGAGGVPRQTSLMPDRRQPLVPRWESSMSSCVYSSGASVESGFPTVTDWLDAAGGEPQWRGGRIEVLVSFRELSHASRSVTERWRSATWLYRQKLAGHSSGV